MLGKRPAESQAGPELAGSAARTSRGGTRRCARGRGAGRGARSRRPTSTEADADPEAERQGQKRPAEEEAEAEEGGEGESREPREDPMDEVLVAPRRPQGPSALPKARIDSGRASMSSFGVEGSAPTLDVECIYDRTIVQFHRPFGRHKYGKYEFRIESIIWHYLENEFFNFLTIF